MNSRRDTTHLLDFKLRHIHVLEKIVKEFTLYIIPQGRKRRFLHQIFKFVGIVFHIVKLQRLPRDRIDRHFVLVSERHVGGIFVTS